MAERRYTEDEVAAIFELASKTERSALPAPADGRGLTLAALQEIGREIGISPESISLAAQSLRMTPEVASRRYLGLPIAVGATLELDGPMSDSQWEMLVAELRTTFHARGTLRYDGPFRQWTNGNLQALVEPTPTGHRLRLQSMKGDARQMMRAGSIAFAAAGATLLATAAGGSLGHSGSAVGIGFMALMGVGMFAAGALRIPGWARLRQAQFAAVIARLTAPRTARDETAADRDL